MKIVLKIVKWLLILVVVLSVLAVGGLYGFLKYGLTGAVQQYVLPEVLAQVGVDTELDQVELDLFKGTFVLNGLRVKNPAGFVEPDLMTVDHAEVLVRLKSLLTQDPIEVQRIKCKGAKVHLIRNREKMLNIQQLQEELAAKLPEQAGPAGEPSSEPTAQPVPLPALVLKALEADLEVDYVDHSERAPIKKGAVTLNLRGRNLATVTAKDVPWGELYLISQVDVDQYGFPANFNLLVAPFDTPENLSFDLKGAPFEMDASLVNKHIKELGMESEKVRLEVDVKARAGVFVVPDSVVGTELKGVTLDKSVAGVALSASALKFKLPVSGTVMRPVIKWRDSVQKVVSENKTVLVKEVSTQFLDKAVRSKDKASLQALGQSFGLDLGLTPAEEVAAAETNEVPSEKSVEPKAEQTKEEQVLDSVLRVLDESKKGDGKPESAAIEEVLKIFGK